jgi:hypothetical protein
MCAFLTDSGRLESLEAHQVTVMLVNQSCLPVLFTVHVCPEMNTVIQHSVECGDGLLYWETACSPVANLAS